MSKRMLINYLLLILIVIFTWIGIKYPITEDQKINRNAITTLKPNNITDIKIETADETLVLKKQGTSWSVVSPVNWFANNISAERIASLAGVEPQSKLPIDQIDISTLGLRIPKAVVTLNQKSIYFGDTNRIGNRRYLMAEPNIYLVSDIHYIFISQGLSGLLDNRLLPSKLDLTELKFSAFSVTKSGPTWSTDATGKSSQAASQLISNWRQKQASIKPYDKTLNPLQKIIARLQSGEEVEFFVLSIKPEIIIARPDLNIQYHFPDHQYYELLSLDKLNQPAGPATIK
ncbi:MAG: DUF4340 domain-containing protein [Gammaproteobacteria bacterium]|nr:DUF4340 domain-containing protein [Gammaproteobacteria bacterium]